jgi:VCBS repeat-containing protein
MAIAAPLLIIMFIGVFEVGWALRGFLVLSNTNREATRFAVKNGTLNYSIKNASTVGYNTVLTHTTASLANQLPLDFKTAPNTTLIMSHFVADTGIPCSDGTIDGTTGRYRINKSASCDCTNGDPTDPDGDGTPWFSKDDLIAHPNDPNFPHYVQVFGVSQPTRLGTGTNAEQSYQKIFGGSSGVSTTQGSYARFAADIALRNNQFNCNVQKTGTTGELSIDNVFVTESYYNQPQLLGVPFISNRLTDPIPFYSHTVMRIVTSRESDTSDTIGPTCELYPITFHDGIFPDPNNPPPNHPIDAFQGSGSGQFGWLTWNPNPSNNNANYAYEELINPRLSMTDFTDANDPNDHSLSIGDDISSGPGVMNSNDVDNALEALVGKTIRVPIYSTGGGTGQNTYFTVTHFAVIRVDQICLPRNSCPGVSGNDKRIKATFLRYEDDACTEAVGGGGGGGNNPPTATNDTATIGKNQPIKINVLSNDSDPDGDTLTVTGTAEVTSPFKGSIAITDGGATVTYTAANQTGSYQFTYTLSDGNGGTATGNVTVNVTNAGNVAPTANPDPGYSVGKNNTLTVSAASGLLGNDSDPDGDTLTAIKLTNPANGSLTAFGADGSFTYTPNANWSGTDTFTYKVNDGAADSGAATVTITVIGNYPPTAVNDSFTAVEDTPLTVNAGAGVLANDTDSENDPLTAIKLTNPANGALTFNSNGSFTYTPNANWYGTDSFTYKANDGQVDSAAATVTIIVNPVNDPPVVLNKSYNVTLGNSLNIDTASGVLAGATDVDSVNFQNAAVVAPPSKASAFTLNANGSFTYTPSSSGTDTFTFKTTDSNGADSNIGTVTITIAALTLQTIAQDNFDGNSSGWSDSWAIGSNGSIGSGSYSPYSNPSHLQLLKKADAVRTVDMRNVSQARLKFRWRVESLDNDSETGEVLVYDGNWHSVYTITRSNNGSGYQYADIDISSRSMIQGFQVQFKINASGTGDYFYVDNIEITGYK